MNSENSLFMLNAFGLTGKPKGVVHTTGGHLCAALTVENVFNVHPDDQFTCMVDNGWITGHAHRPRSSPTV
ncbi:acetyl-CoA synthetase [Marasmius tenuissimus]|nr:acetyl-CoA synthetase [Marasmius tenuissimus]